MNNRIANLLAGSPEYLLALANACLFLFLSIGGVITPPDSLVFALFPNVIFLIGSFVSWLLMMRRGWALTPISWYVLGAGLFFGLGVFAGGLHVHPWADDLHGNDLGYLIQVNTLNAASVLLILFVAGQFIKHSIGINHKSESSLEEAVKQAVPLRYFLLFCLLVIGLKLIFFPDIDNLVARSLLAKIYFLFPAVFLLGGVVIQQMGWIDRLLFSLIFLLQLANGILLCNKYEILMPVIAWMIGMFASQKKYKTTLLMLSVPIIIFWIANPIVSMARLHYKYDAVKNNLVDRINILQDVFNSIYLNPSKPFNPPGEVRDNLSVTQRMTLNDRVRAIGVRFDVASIEAFMIKEFDEGHPGKSLEDFWAVFVPRVLWPEKPIVTRFGYELNLKFYNNNIEHASSAMAPTYSGEAYWNYGWVGVFLVSVYLGIAFGVFTRIGLSAARGADVAYLFVAYPLLVSAAFVESWITATYIGGMAIIVLYYFAIKMLLSLIVRGKKSA